MKDQIAGIEDESKRKLCDKIVAADIQIDSNNKYVGINEVASQIYNEMNKQQGKYKFDNPWKSDEEYKYVYKVYLAELKHYLKIRKTDNGGKQSEQ